MSSDIQDAYTLSITAYALGLVNSAKKWKALTELRKMATEKGTDLACIAGVLANGYQRLEMRRRREWKQGDWGGLGSLLPVPPLSSPFSLSISGVAYP